MIIRRLIICCVLLVNICYSSFLFAQEKKLEKLRVGGGSAFPPYPAGISSLLQDLEKQFPKAKGAKPEDFADSRLVRELDQSGFIKSLLPNR